MMLIAALIISIGLCGYLYAKMLGFRWEVNMRSDDQHEQAIIISDLLRIIRVDLTDEQAEYVEGIREDFENYPNKSPPSHPVTEQEARILSKALASTNTRPMVRPPGSDPGRPLPAHGSGPAATMPNNTRHSDEWS